MIDLKGLMIMSLLVGVAAIAVIISIMLDLASGLRKAKLLGEARTSYAYERTTTKLLSNCAVVPHHISQQPVEWVPQQPYRSEAGDGLITI